MASRDAPDGTVGRDAAALGPGVIGLLDLLDRLTFRECGWYLHAVFVQAPLWSVGLGLSATFLNTWKLS